MTSTMIHCVGLSNMANRSNMMITTLPRRDCKTGEFRVLPLSAPAAVRLAGKGRYAEAFSPAGFAAAAAS
jgi:hypothetical protein